MFTDSVVDYKTHDMSISLKVVSKALTFWASFNRCAILCRMRDIFTWGGVEVDYH